MIPCGAVWLFTNKAEVVAETVAPFNWGEIQGIDIHGIWIVSWVRSLGAMSEAWACVLWGCSLMHQGDFLSNLPLETEVGSFLIPASDGDGNIVHGLDLLHDPDRDSSREIGDEGGGVFDFVVLGTDNI